jgi:very-short-patch-repair endonuclease
MQVLEVVRQAGGVIDTRRLVAFTSRRKVRTALRKGVIVRDARGRYALPTAEAAVRAASRLNAVVSHRSAAAHYGWEMKNPPSVPTVTVPRNRKLPLERREGVDVKWRDVPYEHVTHEGVTGKAWTVIDCAKTLPFDEALAIADSAVRHGDVTRAALIGLALQVPSTGRARCLRVAEAADGRAANPFESVLRAIALDVQGLDVEPQVLISENGFVGTPDLVDRTRRVAIEADSYEFHGKRRGLRRDCERYNALSLCGWLVLRFTYEHVMYRPAYVAECLRVLVASRRPQRRAALPETVRVPA